MNEQLPDFDGATYERNLDHTRLWTQLQRVYDLMADAQWRSLRQIARALDAPEASVSARLRDLRKDKWGNKMVERRRLANGLHEYRLITG